MTTITRRAAFAGTGALLLAPRLAAAAPAIGAPAPDFALPDQDGDLRRLADFRGKVVVLEGTNHDCPYVRKHYGSTSMQALQRLAAERGVTWLTIASSPAGEQGHVSGAQAKELTASRNAAPAAVLLDHRSAAARAYRATVRPTCSSSRRTGCCAIWAASIPSARRASRTCRAPSPSCATPCWRSWKAGRSRRRARRPMAA